MNLQQVKHTVQLIDASKGDYEGAHEMEDDLYQSVLKEVASGNQEAKEMAREALKTKKIDFARYCA